MLKDKLQEDLKSSMIEKNEERTSVIRMLKSAIQYFEIQKGGAGYEATDDDVIEVISKEIKKRNESITLYEKGGRQELADKEKREIEILKVYMPEQISELELREMVDLAVSQTGATQISDMGKVMEILISKTKGKADSTLVSTIVREKLSS